MTPGQKIMREILLRAISRNDIEHDGEITEDNVENLYDQLVESGLHWDWKEEFRCSGEPSGVETDLSDGGYKLTRHYEYDEVAKQVSDGSWVGWTYWHGGGKFGEPESIDWMEYAYDLEVTEEQKMVTVRTFAKK